MTPTPRFLFLLAAGLLPALLAAWPGPFGAWFVAWAAWLAACAAALLVDVRRAPRPADLAVSIDLPPAAAIGRTLRATVRVASSAREVPAGEVVLDVTGPADPPPPVPLVEGACTLELRPRRRGRVRVDAAWVRWTGPLGLVRRVLREPVGAEVDVHPDLALVRSAALPFLGERDERAGTRVERYAGEGTEFHQVVEFVPGRDPRSIDWKASARHRRLLSRDYRAERSRQVVLAIDTGRLMAEPVAGVPRLDHAIHATLLLASVAVGAGDRVGLYAFDARPRAWLPPRGGKTALGAIRHLAAGLEYTTEETNFTLSLTTLLMHLRRRSLVVVFSDFVDTTTAALMVENLRRVAGRHVVLFVTLADQEPGELALVPPRTREDLHRALVAGELARERRRVLLELGRLGVATVEAPAGTAAPAVVRRYLELKRREAV